jgi:predicted ATPase/class 3 adenylate cyclase
VQQTPRPPEGTIALLFTDIEGSTRLATILGEAWSSVLADHHALVGAAIEAQGGFVDGTEGDAFLATFVDARAAGRAAVGALRALREHPWPAGVGELKVRMGLHVGHVERTETGYVGLEVHRAARVAAAAHGGQLIMTSVARDLIGDQLVTESLGSHRLKDFPGAVPLFCAVVDGRGAGGFPRPRTEEVRPTNLPAGAPVLVGRDDDVDRVRDALQRDHERVVTVTGRGGAGKTSLALVVAALLLDEYPGGTWLTRLATVEEPAAVIGAVASAVGAVDVDGSPGRGIIARLRERGATLLLLDNFEHLLPAAPAVAQLVDALPQLQVLITSQAPTRLSSEFCVSLDALDDAAAIALLERVARRRNATFLSDGAHGAALLDVVHLLDGLPLALELAAARLALLTPVQLRDRLRASYEVLRDDRADRSDRHRSLEATLAWTLGLLDTGTQALFLRMGTFTGPVELEDIESVAGADGLDVLGELARLLDVALVRRVETGDGRVRFGLPEALRQIASARLNASHDAAVWRRAHAVRQHEIIWAARHLFVTQTIYDKAVDAGPEIDAALRWAREVGDPLADQIAAARATLLSDLGQLREALSIVQPLLQSPPDDPDTYAEALWAHCWALTVQGRTDEALVSAERLVEVARSPGMRATAVSVRGLAHTFGGDFAAGVRDSAEATAISRSLDHAMLCGALLIEAQARQFAGEPDRAVELLAEAERVGQPVQASFLWRRHTVLGDLAALSGRSSEALEHYADSLEAAELRGNDAQILFDLLGVANALGVLGADEEAIEVAAMAEKLVAELGGPEASATHLVGQEAIDAARERLGPLRTANGASRGQSVPPARRVARACELARAWGLVGSRGVPHP